MSFYPSVPNDISVLVELILGHQHYLLTDVPPHPNSPPDNVICSDRPTDRISLVRTSSMLAVRRVGKALEEIVPSPREQIEQSTNSRWVWDWDPRAQPSEPILFQKLRIYFADFPCLHCSIDQRYAHTQTLLRRSRSVDGTLPGTNQLPYALRVYSPVDSHTCQTPWSVFQDESNGEPTGQRLERTDAEAHRRRAMPATTEEMAFYESIEIPEFGHPQSMPRRVIPPDLGSQLERLSAKGSWSPDARWAIPVIIKRVKIQPPLAATSVDVDTHLGQPRARGAWEASIRPTAIARHMIDARCEGATCVQRLDGSRDSAIHTKYRILLRSSSMREPRYLLSRVIFVYKRSTARPAREGADEFKASVIVVCKEHRTGQIGADEDPMPTASTASENPDSRSWTTTSHDEARKCHGATVPWCHGATVPRCVVVMVSRCLGDMEPWNHGATVPSCHGALLPGAMVPRCHGSTVPWCSFAPLAFQPSAMTNCVNQQFLSC
ncbi:hypothetical protein CQW23_28965 [Capsicum baccatum]|uniref:Uncharacterized protein n=1 Tax=Capsicum baccatum TaxID=33114 RepID=A0A2G2VI46_CAPBA|nr:hypothetical protein CQW23_28965 [Capsicum baccatum]